MQPTVEILELQGSLIATGGQKLFEVVNQRITGEVNTLLIDLSRVRFADSAGLAMLVRMYKLCQGVGVKVALCSIQSQVTLLLELTFMQKIFEVFLDRQAFYTHWEKQFPKDAVLPDLNSIPVIEVKIS